MANRRYTSQFNYSFERMPVSLSGQIVQSGSVGAFATLVNQGITYTAVTMGSAGNSITIALIAGGTAGSEVVSVSGTAISVSIASGTSTQGQIVTAIQASLPASALISVSDASSGTAVNAVAATHLASGADTVLSNSSPMSFSVAQTGTGLYTITLADSYPKLIGCELAVLAPSAANLQLQLASVDVLSAKTVVIRSVAGASPTNLSNGQGILVSLLLRNSKNPTSSDPI